MRFLQYEKHVYSLGRSIKIFVFTAGLLAVSMFVLNLHLKKRRAPISLGTPDPMITHVDPFSDDDIDPDLDIELQWSTASSIRPTLKVMKNLFCKVKYCRTKINDTG